MNIESHYHIIIGKGFHLMNASVTGFKIQMLFRLAGVRIKKLY